MQRKTARGGVAEGERGEVGGTGLLYIIITPPGPRAGQEAFGATWS